MREQQRDSDFMTWRVHEMPQLPISLSADIIAKLNKIAKDNNTELIDNGKEPTIRAATVAARIVKAHFGE